MSEQNVFIVDGACAEALAEQKREYAAKLIVAERRIDELENELENIRRFGDRNDDLPTNGH